MIKVDTIKTINDLKALTYDEKCELWAKYCPHPYKRQLRSLWYYVQCERLCVKVEQKHITKMKKYQENPSSCMTRAHQKQYHLSPGVDIIKHFRGTDHIVTVNDDNTFSYKDQKYKSLSAVAFAICGLHVSGPDFFNLTQRKKK